MSTHRQFHGLHELRFIAALGVVIYHLEINKRELGIGHLAGVHAISALGPLGVALFFVTSGFLINYLLFQERAATGRIDLGSFYRKRAVRIVPLYYLIYFFAAFVLPFINGVPFGGQWDHLTLRSVLLHLAFMPQIALTSEPMVPGATQLWTIGLEVQFYLFWPLYFRALARRPAVLFAVGLAVPWLFHVASKLAVPGTLAFAALRAGATLRFEPFILGGIAAYLVYADKKRMLRFLFHPVTQIATYALLAYLIAVRIPRDIRVLQFITLEWVAFAILVLNVCANPRPPIRAKLPWAIRLGQASYGIYSYHVIVTLLVLTGLLAVVDRHSLIFQLALYPLILAATFAVADFSYRRFELPFMARFRPPGPPPAKNLPTDRRVA